MEGQIELEDYLRSLNCERFDICDYIPKGRANAVTRYELCMKTGFRDRQIRDLIHYARRDGSILNLSDGKGYFRPDLDDPVERGMLAAYVRQEESRAYMRRMAMCTARTMPERSIRRSGG